MVLEFDHTTLGQRVLFGAGSAVTNVERSLKEVGSQRALVLASLSARSVVEKLTDLDAVAGATTGVAQHVPAERVLEARRVLEQIRADAIVSVGGGSATGLAKALGRDTGLPIVAVPTTYSGSEATDMWGETRANRKITGTSPTSLPRVVIYDTDLVAELPDRLAAASGMNALAHAVDSLWAPRADPINRALSAEGMRAVIAGLRGLPDSSTAAEARSKLLYGAYLSAVAFASAGAGLHHKVCHILGGAYALDHAGMHAVLLPYVAAWNFVADAEAERCVAEALGRPASTGLFELRRSTGGPSSLRELGMDQSDIGEAARMVIAVVPEGNPRPVRIEDLQSILTLAYEGREPEALLGKETP